MWWYKRIRILSVLSKDFSILKPDKGNGIVILNRPDYTKSLRFIFDDKSKFSRLNEDRTNTRLNTLHNYLLTLRKRNEISESEWHTGQDTHRSTHTGQYTRFDSFDPWSRKTAWVRSLFHRAVNICSNLTFINKQISMISKFMSWNVS